MKKSMNFAVTTWNNMRVRERDKLKCSSILFIYHFRFYKKKTSKRSKILYFISFPGVNWWFYEPNFSFIYTIAGGWRQIKAYNEVYFIGAMITDNSCRRKINSKRRLQFWLLLRKNVPQKLASILGILDSNAKMVNILCQLMIYEPIYLPFIHNSGRMASDWSDFWRALKAFIEVYLIYAMVTHNSSRRKLDCAWLIKNSFKFRLKV